MSESLGTGADPETASPAPATGNAPVSHERATPRLPDHALLGCPMAGGKKMSVGVYNYDAWYKSGRETPR